MQRKNTRQVKAGNVYIGDNNKIAIQSMCNTDTRDVKKTVEQIKRLEDIGCEIIRVAVPDTEAALAIKGIKKRIKIPLVADIHFDYRLALLSMENGVDKLRINPGNIGSIDRVKTVVEMAKDKNIPIRIGVNSGSLEKDMLLKYGGVTSQALVESALKHVDILEKCSFYDTVISIKSSNVMTMIDSYRLISQRTDYPLHLGVTEAGTLMSGTIKSSVGIGALLSEGIGDTIRVSLTGDPADEVKVGRQILKALGLLRGGIEVISCPTCGRTSIDLIKIATEVEEKITDMDKNLKVAIMGCAVNGPGEAREADIGIAGGQGECLLFKKGEIIRKIPERDIIRELIDEIKSM
ncbi:4-hydroxy-3-methylbut-2-en-1-yl diphosphate synthase [Oxobacter pfennigii]|uniref:4-hydroxy-3-methylbut-2-en-1-yl diphosphate synthase (flavodoxin) n=1 Tax=Oxobacter pfennigii TaxID=36849 RepID=A0A0P9AEY9_9CLOT|nr:flavodoxin-dependent (E)-4-hydroxy-3-methylbut-2-enyl-diphosphate synthase [Oxobacter pfennigii]KPU43909.1 4-hydroxy-3-methylbut-2-en-1-yl diphosphate synthase [Oxobacter pfennigii]